jgi:hypothetical protein
MHPVRSRSGWFHPDRSGTVPNDPISSRRSEVSARSFERVWSSSWPQRMIARTSQKVKVMTMIMPIELV